MTNPIETNTVGFTNQEGTPKNKMNMVGLAYQEGTTKDLYSDGNITPGVVTRVGGWYGAPGAKMDLIWTLKSSMRSNAFQCVPRPFLDVISEGASFMFDLARKKVGRSSDVNADVRPWRCQIAKFSRLRRT